MSEFVLYLLRKPKLKATFEIFIVVNLLKKLPNLKYKLNFKFAKQKKDSKLIQALNRNLSNLFLTLQGDLNIDYM